MALQADALDFAGDLRHSLACRCSPSPRPAFRSKAAMVKGVSLALMGVYVLAASLWRTFVAGAPDAVTMGGRRPGALRPTLHRRPAAAALPRRRRQCPLGLALLAQRRHRQCRRASCAAGIVASTGTRWADLAVAAIMASLFPLDRQPSIIRQPVGSCGCRPPSRVPSPRGGEGQGEGAPIRRTTANQQERRSSRLPCTRVLSNGRN